MQTYCVAGLLLCRGRRASQSQMRLLHVGREASIRRKDCPRRSASRPHRKDCQVNEALAVPDVNARPRSTQATARRVHYGSGHHASPQLERSTECRGDMCPQFRLVPVRVVVPSPALSRPRSLGRVLCSSLRSERAIRFLTSYSIIFGLWLGYQVTSYSERSGCCEAAKLRE
jgi:hypothetical protein